MLPQHLSLENTYPNPGIFAKGEGIGSRLWDRSPLVAWGVENPFSGSRTKQIRGISAASITYKSLIKLSFFQRRIIATTQILFCKAA